MGFGEKVERSTGRVTEVLRRQSAHAAAGLWTWIRHRPVGFFPRIVPTSPAPLAAELRALLALTAGTRSFSMG